MKRSVAEISAVIAKAARGAGLPLGVVEELALAAPWLSGADLGELAQILCAPDRHSLLFEVCGALDELACGRDGIEVAAAAQLAAAIGAGRGLPVKVTNAGELRRVAACPTPQIGPVDLVSEDWDQLEQLAARTYVPSTEASRQAGAGAGLIDND